MRKVKKFSQGGRAEAARDRRMADIEKDYQRAIAKGKSEKEAKAKRDQRIADARDDYAKRTGGDRTETRAAEKAAEARLSAARRGVDKDMKPVSVLSGGNKSLAAKADMPKVDTPKIGEDKPKAGGYDSMSFSAAFRQAMKDKGRGETFTWKGKSYKLETAGSAPAPVKKAATPAPAPVKKAATPAPAPVKKAATPARPKTPGREYLETTSRRQQAQIDELMDTLASPFRAARARGRQDDKARGFAKGGKIDGIAIRGKTRLKRKK